MTENLKSIGSSIAKLRALLAEARKDLLRIETLQNALAESLSGLWADAENLIRDENIWRESLSLIGSGRVLGIAAQAEEALASNTNSSRTKLWTSDGAEYSTWLSRGIIHLIRLSDADRFAAQLCGRAFSLGHLDVVVEQVLDTLVLSPHASSERFNALLVLLSRHEQKQFLTSTLKLISRRYLSESNTKLYGEPLSSGTTGVRRNIGGSAALLKYLIIPKTVIETEMCDWLTSNPCSNGVARAVLAAQSLQSLRILLDRSWQQFGDKLRIKHTPILQQESNAQILLMTAGYVHRSEPNYVYTRARSSIHTHSISERLSSSSPRVRFLGMVVGTAISQLIDQPDSRMIFDDKALHTPEGLWYSRLVEIDEGIGSISELNLSHPQQAVVLSAPKKPASKLNTLQSVKSKIVEVPDNDSSSTSEFLAYEKPDSDREDEEEDPTLAKREKLKSPVYIRDLITGLKDTEHYDRHLLALSTAAALIRRKADFGSELKDRLEELALTLIGLGDPFEMEGWHDMRQQAMIATIVARPRQLGPWYARVFFNGDYSISQRASILVSLGLAARELAGFQKESQVKAPMPSQKLPEHLHKLYVQTTEVDSLSRQLERTMLMPMTTKQRRTLIRNDLAGLVAESFFFPLTGYWHSCTHSSQTRSTFLDPFLLPLFLKTIAIITSASGGSTVFLPQMTSEFWQLLLSLRSQALHDRATLEAELFSFLTILNVNEDRRHVASENSTELLETQEWVGMVFERLSGDDEESERCKVLAAGVLVAIKDIVDDYHRLMVEDILRI